MKLMTGKSWWKKIPTCIVFVFCCMSAFAQSTYYSCDTREYCDWDSVNLKFVNCTPKDESSLFKLNGDKSIFEHTTSDLKSAYYVSKHEHDAVNDVEVYDVTSDVGNKYTFIVDTAYSELRILNTAGEAIYMLRFHIKSTWTD